MTGHPASLPMRVSALLVTLITLVLIAYGVVAALAFKNREVEQLQDTVELEVKLLQTTLAGSLWHFDLQQVEKVLDGGMQDKTIVELVVTSEVRKFARYRNHQGDVLREPTLDILSGDISIEGPVIYQNEHLGNLFVVATTKYLRQEILGHLLYLGGSIIVLDLILIATLYGVLSRVILQPIVLLKEYALSLIGGQTEDEQVQLPPLQGELGVLKDSLDNMFALLDHRYTELQTEARRFKESEDRFRTLANTIPDLIWLKNTDGVFLSCNKTFAQFLALSEQQIIGKTDYELFNAQQVEGFRYHDRQAIVKGSTHRNEEWRCGYDGSQKLYEVTKTPMFDSEGQLVGVLGIGHDITGRKQAEDERAKLQEQLSQAQKLESVGRLAGGVAHDFNNMLGVILGHADLVLSQLEEESKLAEDIQEIIQAANRSADLTRHLLAFARKQAVAPRVVYLNDTVENMIKMLRRLIGEDITLQWDLGERLWLVNMDPSQFDQILINLCINARDAIESVGQITITTQNKQLDEQFCRHIPDARPGDFIEITVSDTGHGMDKEVMSRIFEPFYTTKDMGVGTGLGLATVHGIVKQNQGFIQVESELDAGATFHVFLPRFEGTATEALGMEPSTPVTPVQGTILLVEDEPSMLRIVKRALENEGYDILTACTPTEAIRLNAEYKERIDLLVTDVVMPEMNGRDLAEKLVAMRPTMKYLFMSGYTPEVVVQHGILNQKAQFLQKPFSNKELLSKVRMLLEMSV